jgi:hypothetical protein
MYTHAYAQKYAKYEKLKYFAAKLTRDHANEDSSGRGNRSSHCRDVDKLHKLRKSLIANHQVELSVMACLIKYRRGTEVVSEVSGVRGSRGNTCG